MRGVFAVLYYSFCEDQDIVPSHRKLWAAARRHWGKVKRLCFVYGLFSTEDMVIRYIGQTLQPIKRRLTQHLATAKRDDAKCYRWIRKAIRDGHRIGFIELEAGCQWDIAEREWIAAYNRHHPGQLTNTSEGGCGYSGKKSEAWKAAMRRPKSEAHKAAMRKPKSAEQRASQSRGLLGNTRARGERNRAAVLTGPDVISIKQRLSLGEGVSDIAREYGLQKAAISKIKTGRNWKHIAL